MNNRAVPRVTTPVVSGREKATRVMEASIDGFLFRLRSRSRGSVLVLRNGQEPCDSLCVGYWGEIAKEAWRETRAEVRWDSPVRVIGALGSPIFAAGVVWYFTRELAWAAISGLAFLVVLATGCFLVKFCAGPGRRQAETDARLEALESKIAAPLARHPDGIYQHGNLVGVVRGADVILPKGVVRFLEIYNGQNFNHEAEFEYRAWVLRLTKFSGMSGWGDSKAVRVRDPECEILRGL